MENVKRRTCARQLGATAGSAVPSTAERAFADNVAAYHRRLSPIFPDIPSGDLHLILRNLLKPADWPRRFLLRQIRKGVYVP